MMKSVHSITLLTVFAALVFSGCSEVTGGFEEYAGVNLLEYNSGASVHDFVSGDWTDAAADANYFVANFADTPPDSTGLPAAVVNCASLEIPNLVTNGDFENGGTANWSTAGGNTAASDGLSELDGTFSLWFSTLASQANMVEYDLTSLPDGFVNNANYYFQFDFKGINVNRFEINGGNTGGLDTQYFSPPWEQSTEGGSYVRYSIGDVTSDTLVSDSGSATPCFSIGTQNPDLQQGQEGYLDNFQVVRADIDKWIYFEVTLEETGRLALVSGTYEFSFYVRTDTTRTTPTVLNTFLPTAVAVQIEDLTPYPNSNSWTSTAYASGWDASWQQISVHTELIDIETSVAPADPVLRLGICPTDFFNQASGLLFISTPTLSLVL